MHLISFDASPRQVSKLRNGHAVRIKRGTGFNLVVSPSTYNLVSRAFNKNKGFQMKLTPEEAQANLELSPEQHEEMAKMTDTALFTPRAEGGSIFSKIKKALHSKTAKKIGRELKPLSRELKKVGREMAHEKIAEAHMRAADKYGDNPHASRLLSATADTAHHAVGGSFLGGLKKFGRQVNKALHSKTAKSIGRELKPLSRELKKIGREMAHEKIAEAHMAGADRYGSDPRMARLMNVGADVAHHSVGHGLGAGLGAGRTLAGDVSKAFNKASDYLGFSQRAHGRGMNAHEALRLANIATAHAGHQLAKMHNASVHGMITQPPIKRYWDEPLAPPSRGTGISGMNLIRGRGSMIAQDSLLPPALQSQPYGANFHMQFFLPPEYHRYNDGTSVEGRGLYI